MKLSFKNISILSIVGIFLFSIMMCCCFTNIVEAEELTPSCHQTTRDTESSKSTEVCDCDQTSVVLKEEVVKSNVLEIVSFFSVDNHISHEFYIAALKIDYHVPPIYYDTSPLYIKHSVLRI